MSDPGCTADTPDAAAEIRELRDACATQAMQLEVHAQHIRNLQLDRMELTAIRYELERRLRHMQELLTSTQAALFLAETMLGVADA